MKICEYGCGQEAKYQFKNGRWCCSNHYRRCIKQKKLYSGKNNPLYGKVGYWKGKKNIEHSQRMKRTYLHSEETKIKIANAMTGKISSRRLTIKEIKKRYPTFYKEEKPRYNPDKPKEKEIQVHCKNHLCENSKEKGGWFTPIGSQFYERIRQIEHPDGQGGCYFYCSDECKNICPLYNLRSDPLKDTKRPYTQKEINIWRQKVLELDNYQCQYCGEEATDTHHEKPVKTHPHLALDSDNGISTCEGCHYKYGHKTGTECSTGNLANKILHGCTLGNSLKRSSYVYKSGYYGVI